MVLSNKRTYAVFLKTQKLLNHWILSYLLYGCLNWGEAKSKSIALVLKDQKMTKSWRWKPDQWGWGTRGADEGEHWWSSSVSGLQRWFTLWWHELHIRTHCTDASFLVLMLCDSYVRCNHEWKLGEGYRGPLLTIVATYCECKLFHHKRFFKNQKYVSNGMCIHCHKNIIAWLAWIFTFSSKSSIP